MQQVDSDDAHHAAMKELLQGTAGRLITTWPVVTETSSMLDVDARAAGLLSLGGRGRRRRSRGAAGADVRSGCWRQLVDEQVEWALHFTTGQFPGTKA